MKNPVREKLANGQPVCFENTYEEIAFKYQPDSNITYIAKQKGGQPYPIKSSTIIFTEGLLEGKEISPDEFENY